ncbi:MAG: EAL domain-containing protein [Lachnospiraceae bacterium]|nr:EAL domain-containing protein [Lachnospiraceae bacterium]
MAVSRGVRGFYGLSMPGAERSGKTESAGGWFFEMEECDMEDGRERLREGRAVRAGKCRGRIARVSVLFLVLFAVLAPLAVTAGAQDTSGSHRRTVRVGFFPMEGFHEKEPDGNYSGMDVEYLEALCAYVDWEIEYVECESWDKALSLLREEKLDLVGSAQFSEERAKIYQYADLSSGYTFGAVAVKGDSPVAYEDFDAMKEITYGVVKTYVRKNEFYEYMEGHGILSPPVKEYESAAALHEALNSGEVDALVHSLTEVRKGQRIVGRFAPKPIFYISYPGNDDLMRELNQGISDIKMNRPGLENELMAKYYDSRLDQTVLLTNEEKNYIAGKGTMTVGYLDGYYPFSYESDGEAAGLAKQMLERVASRTGLKFTYVRLDGMQEAKALLRDGEIDILCYCGESAQSLKDSGIVLTKRYAQAPHVIVRKKRDKSKKIQTLAIAYNNESREHMMAFVGEDAEILTYASQLLCLGAVDSGEADAAVCDGYLAEYLLGSKFSFGKMEIHSVLSDVHPIYMAVREDATCPLSGILNKELSEVSDKMVNDYMLQDNFYSRQSLENFISDNSIPIIALLVFAALVVILVMHKMLRNSRRIQKLMYKDTDFNIWNLNYLNYRASRKLASERNSHYAVVYTDISQFRRYNALYGWQAGRKILALFIEVVAEKLDKGNELYARSRGDHFVLFVRYDDEESLKIRLHDIENSFSEKIYEKLQMHMTLAMGVCCIPKGETELDAPLAYGIQAVEMLKGRYSNEIQFYDDRMRKQLKEHHEREKLLEAVDVWKDFTVFYQAKVDIRNERIVGAEALVRFMDPTENGKIRAPGFFVPYYEQTGKITEIDFYVMEAVCKMLRRRLDAKQRVVPISCNFSRIHFVKEGFPERFEEVIARYKIPKEYIEVEITETLVVEELSQQRVKETVDILRKNGVRLSIDDFGSGYSSLGVFEQIPASVIKLDRSFLLNNENRIRQVKIMRNIVNLAQELDAQVVCEGVETQEDTELMMEIGAYVAQGYRYCKPVPEEQFENMLLK